MVLEMLLADTDKIIIHVALEVAYNAVINIADLLFVIGVVLNYTVNHWHLTVSTE